MITSIEGGIGEPRPKPSYPAVAGLWRANRRSSTTSKRWATVPVILARGAELVRRPGRAGQHRHGGLLAGGPDCQHRPGRGSAGHEPCASCSKGLAAVAATARRSKRCRRADHREDVCRRACLTCPSRTSRCRPSARSWDQAAWWCWTKAPAWWTWRAISCNFTRLESCGKCTACRSGHQAPARYPDPHRPRTGHCWTIWPCSQEVGEVVKGASLCGLGQTAPNPVLSTLRYFREEYEAHVVDHRCPAGKCPMTAEV